MLIEVKSGKDYTSHSALDNVMSVPAYGVRNAMVFCSDNLRVAGNILYLPVYMAMFLCHRTECEPMVYVPDLSGL